MSSLRETLHSAARGDRAAIDKLLAEAYPEVRRLVHAQLARDHRPGNRWVGALFSTDDIVQDVFLGVIQGLGDFAGEADREFYGWIATQVKNRIVDRMRFHRAQRRDVRRQAPPPDASGPPPIAAADPTPSRHAMLDERARLFELALATMTEREKQLWELRAEQDLGFAEIAERLAYADAESARSVFRALRAKLIVRLRRLGIERAAESE